MYTCHACSAVVHYVYSCVRMFCMHVCIYTQVFRSVDELHAAILCAQALGLLHQLPDAGVIVSFLLSLWDEAHGLFAKTPGAGGDIRSSAVAMQVAEHVGGLQHLSVHAARMRVMLQNMSNPRNTTVVLCNTSNLALFDVPRPLSRGLPPVAVNLFAVLLADLSHFRFPPKRVKAMMSDLAALQNRDPDSPKFGGVFDDCSAASVSLESSVFAAVTLYELRHGRFGSQGESQHADEGGNGGMGDDGGEGGGGARECWGWSCLNVSGLATGNDGQRLFEEAGGEGAGLDVNMLECFLGRAATDLMSGYLVHWAVSASPELLPRRLRAGVSYELIGPGRQQLSPMAWMHSASREGRHEVVQGLEIRPTLTLTSFGVVPHAGLAVSVTVCRLAAAGTAGDEACGHDGGVVVQSEGGIMDWDDSMLRYRGRDLISTQGLIGPLRFHVHVTCQVVGLGQVGFTVSDTKMIAFGVNVVPLAIDVAPAPAPAQPEDDTFADAPTHVHAKGDEPASVAEQGQGAEAGAGPASPVEGIDVNFQTQGHASFVSQFPPPTTPPQPPPSESPTPPPRIPRKTYGVGSRVPVGTNLTLMVEVLQALAPQGVTRGHNHGYVVTFKVLDSSLLPLAIRRVSGKAVPEADGPAEAGRAPPSRFFFHYYLHEDALVPAGRVHLVVEISDDATGIVHTRRMVWYTLAAKMAATDRSIDKYQALLGDSVTVRMVPGLVLDNGLFRSLSVHSARHRTFIMDLVLACS